MRYDERNKLEVAKLLLENGAQVDIQDYGGWSAVMIASLIDDGAQVDLQHKGGGSALMMASQGGHLKWSSCC